MLLQKRFLRPDLSFQGLDLASDQISPLDLQPVPENKNTQNPYIQKINKTLETQVKKPKIITDLCT